MKKILVFSVIIFAVLLLLPLVALKKNSTSSPAPLSATASTVVQQKHVRLLISDTGEICNLPLEDYLFGVVAAEMPALYEPEALKAQAVCSYTFTLWRSAENAENNYDITDDFHTDQAFISLENARKKWGSKADEYEQKIRNCINSVMDQALTYDGQIILSVYHSLSGGTTESAKNVWGKNYPYLQSVASVGDKLAPDYISTVSVSPKQIESALSVTLPAGLKGSFANFVRSDSGTVKTLKVGGKEFKGSQIREAFGLKSSNFEVALKNSVFTFTVYGYGHGVGMSQNGANYMAQQGSDYKEILKHYYTGCEITKY